MMSYDVDCLERVATANSNGHDKAATSSPKEPASHNYIMKMFPLNIDKLHLIAEARSLSPTDKGYSEFCVVPASLDPEPLAQLPGLHCDNVIDHALVPSSSSFADSWAILVATQIMNARLCRATPAYQKHPRITQVYLLDSIHAWWYGGCVGQG